MIQPILVLVAETILLDQQTNAVSAINLIEEFSSPGYPLLVPRLSILSTLERDSLEDQGAVAQVDVLLGDTSIFHQEADISFNEGSLVSRLIFRFEGFVIQQAGTLRVRVAVGETSAESVSIRVTPMEQQPQVLES